jgi:hypothetical protein
MVAVVRCSGILENGSRTVRQIVAMMVFVCLLETAGCGGGGSTASECELCTLAEHTGQVFDHCQTGHGANGHRLECAQCQRNCAPNAASLRCANNLDSTVCKDGIY